ncbi:MAG: TonB-dependent receptor [Halieaceae bacterium]|jgi:iron complex outermembrane receptor protein|nr:TonB-dependent receptor [Halieaceae bacterium]
MFKSKPLVTAVAIAIPLSFIASELSAAVLEETVVTAQKREQSVQDVGIAITAYTGDQLSQLGFTNAQQVTSMAPGVQTIQPNGEANYSVAVRGVVANDFSTNVESPVALYIDEVYISQMSGAGFMLYDMERVEILRGPQGTLFGRNATGGLVHYITEKPTRDLDGYIMGSVGDYEQYSVEGAVGGGNDWVSGRFSGVIHNADGYINNQFPGKGKLNNANDESYRAQVMFTPTEDLQILLNLRHGEENIDTGFFYYVSSVEAGKLTPGVPNPILDGYAGNRGDVFSGTYDDPGFNELETDGYTATVRWSLGDINLTSITDYSTTKRNYIEDTDSSPTSFFQFFLTTDAEQTSQELRLDGVTDNFSWVAGLYYLGLDIDDSNGYQSDAFSLTGGSTIPGAIAGIYNPYTSNLDSYSGFGEIDYKLTDKVNLILGARYIVDEKDFEYTNSGVDFTAPDSRNFDASRNLENSFVAGFYEDSRKDEEWSGRAGLNWSFRDDLLLYTTWNLGIRGGGYNAPIIPLAFTGDDYTDEIMSYDPEKLYAYEVGFKSTLFDGLARLNGAAYYYDYQDYQAFFIFGIQTFTVNTDAESKGAELELVTSPVEGLDILLGAAYNDIDVDLPGGGTSPSVVAPEWNLNAMIRYEWPMFGGYLALQGDTVYVDNRVFALTGLEPSAADSYTVSNVSVSYATQDRKWLARAFVDNVTDEEYLVQTFDLSGMDNFGMTEQYFGRPQWWGVSLQYKFGG